jgi:hypothetical protein
VHVIFPHAERREDGSVGLLGISPLYLKALSDVPGLLEKPEGKVRERLFPEPSDEAKQREEWERLVRPELFALVASAREILERDMKGLEPAEPLAGVPLWRVEIPAQHVNAWISALNAARLALGALHGVENSMDLRPDLVEKDGEIEIDERTLAVLEINALADLQWILIMRGLPEGERPRAPEEEGPGEGDAA